jgi:hypothetical protein
MMFPLFDIDDGKITSLKGEVSYLYKIMHADLSQKSGFCTSFHNVY